MGTTISKIKMVVLFIRRLFCFHDYELSDKLQYRLIDFLKVKGIKNNTIENLFHPIHIDKYYVGKYTMIDYEVCLKCEKIRMTKHSKNVLDCIINYINNNLNSLDRKEKANEIATKYINNKH